MTALVYENLLAAIGAAPALPGARCKNRAHLFDGAEPGENPATVEQRHAQALALCSRCDAAKRCLEWFEALPARNRPVGVVAGQINRGPEARDGRPPGRSRSALADAVQP
jgi:hypothetical protein